MTRQVGATSTAISHARTSSCFVVHDSPHWDFYDNPSLDRVQLRDRRLFYE